MSSTLAVIMPVRNGMPFLAEAIDSVLTQRGIPLNLVVVDDGSTDGTRDFLAHLPSNSVKVLETPGLGPAAARNAGLRSSHSDLVAFLDADDIWLPNTLRNLTAALLANHAAQFSRGMIRNFNDSPSGERHFLTSPYRFINLGACLWRRSLFTALGLLDEDLNLCEDLDLLMRCWERDIAKVEIDEVILHYRRHAASMTHGLTSETFGTVKAYKKRIERIRAGKFDPTARRHYRQDAYLGAPPPHQDGASHVALA